LLLPTSCTHVTAELSEYYANLWLLF